MNAAILTTNFDAITLDQLDTISGGSVWGSIKHVAGAVGHSAKVAVSDMVNGAGVGAAGGAIVGAVAGSPATPAGMAAGAGVGSAIGGAAGGVFGLGYGIGHEIGTHLK